MTAPVICHAIILKSHETGNTSEVVHAISPEYGRLAIYARGLRRPKNPYRSVLQPLSLVEATLSLKEHAEMGTLREASLLESPEAIVSDFERFSLGLLLAEAAWRACDIHQAAEEIFQALLDALKELDPQSGKNALLASCRGFIRIQSASGYQPQLDPALLRPWPSGQLKPKIFWLDLETATLHARGHQPAGAPVWPMDTDPRDPRVPLPPSAARFLYESARGGEAAQIGEGEALQFLEGLIRLHEYHHEGRLRAADFWRRIQPGG